MFWLVGVGEEVSCIFLGGTFYQCFFLKRNCNFLEVYQPSDDRIFETNVICPRLTRAQSEVWKNDIFGPGFHFSLAICCLLKGVLDSNNFRDKMSKLKK